MFSPCEYCAARDRFRSHPLSVGNSVDPPPLPLSFPPLPLGIEGTCHGGPLHSAASICLQAVCPRLSIWCSVFANSCCLRPTSFSTLYQRGAVSLQLWTGHRNLTASRMLCLPVFIILLLLVSPAVTLPVESKLQRALTRRSSKAKSSSINLQSVRNPASNFGMRTVNPPFKIEPVCCAMYICC